MPKPRRTPRRWYRLAALTGLGLLVFASGLLIGHFAVPAGTVPPNGGRAADLGNFWQVKRLIETQYPGTVNTNDLITGATKGLVAGLGDPYSEYLTADEAKELTNNLDGTVEGIGVEIGERNDQVTVIAPLPDSPAAKAGIQAGDLITAVADQPTSGKSLDAVAKQIRGPAGSQVTVEVQTPGSSPRSLTLTREKVKSPSVALSFQDNVAILKLSRFGDDTKADFDKAVAEIQARQPRGVVLDLRSNPGGFVTGAIDVTSAFLNGGTVVKEQFAGGRVESENAVSDGRLAGLPVVVLVNQGTASAAEITAGALRDNRGSKLVGEPTFGKGSVQELENLSGGNVLKLTVAEWLTPNGTAINKTGLKPDITVPSSDPAAQLQAALNALR